MIKKITKFKIYQIDAAVYSKIDGVFSPFVRPDPIHVCKVHEHEDPLIKFIHDEVVKFGNVTKARKMQNLFKNILKI